MTMNSRTGGLAAFITMLVLLAAGGCRDKYEAEEAPASHAGHAHAAVTEDHDAHDSADDHALHEDDVSGDPWCFEHDVPEAECTKCNPELIAEFKATGDWCAGHGLPESQCLLCNPELKAKLDAIRPARPAEQPAEASDMIVEQWRAPLRPPNDPTCDVESNQIRLLDPSIAVKAGIGVEPAEQRRISADIECPGEIAYNQTQLAHITPRTPGVIVEANVDLGTEVGTGDVLAVIDSASLGRLKSEYIESRESFLIAQSDLERHHAIHNAIQAMLSACEQDSESEQLRQEYAGMRIGEAKSRLLTAHSQLELARQRYDREKGLAEKGISTQESLQSAKNDLDKAEAEFAATHESIDIEMEKEHLAFERALRVARVAKDAAKRQLIITGVNTEQIEALDDGRDQALGRYQLRSPMSGTVVSRHAVVGENAEADAALFSVADLSSMWLMLSLQERSLLAVNPGKPVSFVVDGLPTRYFRGTLDWISSEVDERTRTVAARVLLDNPDGLLRANMFGAARVVVRDNEEVLTIPEDAVQSDGCCSLVFVKHNDTLYRPHKVELGLASNGYVEILGGLSAGEPVVTTGAFLLKTEILKSSIGAGCCEVDPGR